MFVWVIVRRVKQHQTKIQIISCSQFVLRKQLYYSDIESEYLYLDGFYAAYYSDIVSTYVYGDGYYAMSYADLEAPEDAPENSEVVFGGFYTGYYADVLGGYGKVACKVSPQVSPLDQQNKFLWLEMIAS